MMGAGVLPALRQYGRSVTRERAASVKKHAWALAGLWTLIIVGIYIYTSVPPAEHGTQEITTTVVAGDYSATAVTITGGTLISSRPAGMKGELSTLVEYQMVGESTAWRGPMLVARIAHDSGTMMTCRMGKTYLLSPTPNTYRLRCDRTVNVGELGQWTLAELSLVR